MTCCTVLLPSRPTSPKCALALICVHSTVCNVLVSTFFNRSPSSGLPVRHAYHQTSGLTSSPGGGARPSASSTTVEAVIALTRSLFVWQWMPLLFGSASVAGSSPPPPRLYAAAPPHAKHGLSIKPLPWYTFPWAEAAARSQSSATVFAARGSRQAMSKEAKAGRRIIDNLRRSGWRAEREKSQSRIGLIPTHPFSARPRLRH